jgi:hypothetical protein
MSSNGHWGSSSVDHGLMRPNQLSGRPHLTALDLARIDRATIAQLLLAPATPTEACRVALLLLVPCHSPMSSPSSEADRRETLMLRICTIVLFSVFAFGTAFAQQSVPKEVRQAKAGESCEVLQQDCLQWCNKNQIGNMQANIDCRTSCPRYQGICNQTGVWSTPLGKVEIRGLPPK